MMLLFWQVILIRVYKGCRVQALDFNFSHSAGSHRNIVNFMFNFSE